MTTGARFDAVHHVGITVVDLDRSVAFWERLLGVSSRNRRVLDGPQVGVMVGYPGIRIDSCWLDLPGGIALELLQYLDREDEPNPAGTAHAGNVHVCLHVEDMASAHAHAVACGATPVSASPIEVAAGPRAGTRLAYLRDPDGVTIELVQPPATTVQDRSTAPGVVPPERAPGPTPPATTAPSPSGLSPATTAPPSGAMPPPPTERASGAMP